MKLKITFDTIFMPMASPVVATNLTNSKRPATTHLTDFNLANLKLKESWGSYTHYVLTDYKDTYIESPCQPHKDTPQQLVGNNGGAMVETVFKTLTAKKEPNLLVLLNTCLISIKFCSFSNQSLTSLQENHPMVWLKNSYSLHS